MSYLKYILVAVFLYMVFNSSSAIGCTNYMILFSALAVPFVLKRKYFDTQGVILICFSVLYVLFTILNREIDTKDILGLLICPFAFYCFGRYIITNFTNNESSIELFFLLTIISSSVVFYYYSYLDYLIVGVENVSRRLTVEGTVDKNATYYGLLGSLGLAGIPIFFYNLRLRQSPVIYGLLLVGLFSTLTILHLINRTGLVILAAIFMLLFIYKLRGRRNNSFTSVLVIFVVLFLVIYFVAQNELSSEVAKAYTDRAEEGMQGFGGRGWRWTLGLENLLFYPFGWAAEFEYKELYCHNLWLDASRSAGVIPFFLLVYYSIIDIKHFFSIYKNDNKGVIAYILMAYFVTFFLSSFMEPVIDGFVLYFFLYCLIGGCLNQYNKDIKKIYRQ